MLLNFSSIRDYLRPFILPLDEIDKFAPKKGSIVDLGCGEGIIARHLAKIRTRQIQGIDSDQSRLPKSQQSNLNFQKGDITNVNLRQLDAVILSDVLHHINYQEQENLLKKIFQALNKNGVLIIKEIDSGEFIRSKLSRLWDFILYPQDEISYTSTIELTKKLTFIGFKLQVTRPRRLFPGSTTLYLCKK